METPRELLADQLIQLAEEAEKSDKPVYRLWATVHVDKDALHSGYYDVEDLLESLDVMLKDTDMFLSEPEGIQRLRALRERIGGEKDAYLRQALPVQKQRLSRLLKDADFQALEKRHRNLQRYLANAQARLAVFSDPNEENRLHELFLRRVEKLDRKVLRKLPPSFDLLTAVENAFQLAPEVIKIRDEIMKDVQDRYKKAQEAVQSLAQQLDLAEKQLATHHKLKVVFEHTGLRLDRLGISDAPVPAPSVDASSLQTSSTAPLQVPAERPSARIDQPKMKHVAEVTARPQPSAPHHSMVVQSAPEHASERPDDVVKLRAVVDFARTSGGKIRVVVPAGKAGRYIDGWEAVFRALGFSGKVEAVDQKTLQHTSDIDSPIIVPRKMNGHTHKWSGKSFAMITVIDNASTNQLQAMVGRSEKTTPANDDLDEQGVA